MQIKEAVISPVVTTSATNQGMGFWSKRFLDLNFYNEVLGTIKKTGTTNILKSTTPRVTIGNVKPWFPWTALKYVRPFEEFSMANAVALTNFGPCVNACLSYLSTVAGYNVLPSIFVPFDKYRDLDEAIEDAMKAVRIYSFVYEGRLTGIEWNGSCGNSGEDITKNAHKLERLGREAQKQFPGIAHGVKVGEAHSLDVCVRFAEIFDYLHSMNSVLMGRLHPGQEHTSPLHGLKNVNQGGSISGLRIHNLALTKNKQLARELESNKRIRFIFAGGITFFNQARYYFDHVIDQDRHSIGQCTGIERNPREAIRIINAYNGTNI